MYNATSTKMRSLSWDKMIRALAAGRPWTVCEVTALLRTVKQKSKRTNYGVEP